MNNLLAKEQVATMDPISLYIPQQDSDLFADIGYFASTPAHVEKCADCRNLSSGTDKRYDISASVDTASHLARHDGSAPIDGKH